MANPYAPASPYGAPPGGNFPIPPPGGAALPANTIQTVRSLRSWSKFVGIMMMVLGGFYCLSIVGIFAGWLPILLGYWILKSGENLALYAERGDLAALELGLSQLRNYFLALGIVTILMVVSILFVILMYLIMGAAMLAMVGLGGAAAAAGGP